MVYRRAYALGRIYTRLWCRAQDSSGELRRAQGNPRGPKASPGEPRRAHSVHTRSSQCRFVPRNIDSYRAASTRKALSCIPHSPKLAPELRNELGIRWGASPCKRRVWKSQNSSNVFVVESTRPSAPSHRPRVRSDPLTPPWHPCWVARRVCVQ